MTQIAIFSLRHSSRLFQFEFISDCGFSGTQVVALSPALSTAPGCQRHLGILCWQDTLFHFPVSSSLSCLFSSVRVSWACGSSASNLTRCVPSSVRDLGSVSWMQVPWRWLHPCPSLQVDLPSGTEPVFLFIFINPNVPSVMP